MLSARELDVEQLAEARTWTNERLVYTHGYGITAVPVDAVTAQGQPDYLVSGINPEPQLPIGEPRIYFGEATDTYVITGTTPRSSTTRSTRVVGGTAPPPPGAGRPGSASATSSAASCSRSASATSTC